MVCYGAGIAGKIFSAGFPRRLPCCSSNVYSPSTSRDARCGHPVRPPLSSVGIQPAKKTCHLRSCTRQSLNPSGLMAFNCGASLRLKHEYTTKISKQIQTQNHSTLLTDDTLQTISTCHTLEARLKDSARDTPIGWKNVLHKEVMKEVKTTRRLKRKLPRDSCD